jgi:hypothetical protein
MSLIGAMTEASGQPAPARVPVSRDSAILADRHDAVEVED